MRRRGKRENSAGPFLLRAAVVCCLCFWARCTDASPVIAAYQEIYRMNFEVINQDGLPSGWYVTGDGYAVAQVRPNHWVYGSPGQLGRPNTLVPTEVAVGAAVPMDVPQLARVAVFSGSGRVYGTEKFMAVTNSRLDNMGVLNDPLVYTPVAWKSNEAGLRIWLGDRWYKIVPRGGQSTYRAFMAKHPYIVRMLEKNDVPWTMYDTEELADLAREWGFLWHGHIRFQYLPKGDYRDSGDSGSESGTQTVSIGEGTPSSPSTPGGSAGGGNQWDTGDGGGSGGGNTGNTGNGGNWDK